MKKLYLLILLLFTTVSFAQVQQQWVRTYWYGGSQGSYINTDASGNIYVVGSMTGMDSPVSTIMIAYSNDGTILWSNGIDTPCAPVGVSIDSLYNQYIAGYYVGPWGPSSISIHKFSSAGAQIWSIVEPVTLFYDRTYAMTGDRAGNTFVARMKDSVKTLRKYNSAGILQFSVYLTDTVEPQSITLDPQGNIIISGFTDAGSIYSCATFKFTPSGTIIWGKIFVPNGNGLVGYSGIKISTAADGSIYILCTSRDSQNHNSYTLLKYNSAGTQQWVSYCNPMNLSPEASAMCIEYNANKSHNIIATGTRATVKFSSNGEVIWMDTTQSFYDIKRDNSGNFYLTGTTYNYPHDMRTIKLSAGGTKLWDITYNGSYNYEDGARALTLDNSGNVYITGYCNSIPIFGSTFATTIKYSQYVIDSSSINFLPLAIGNIWVYKHYTNTPPSSNFEYRGKVKYQIVRDTLMPNGKRYYDRTYLGYTRINPENLSVFVYAEAGEVRKDSLKAKLLDTVMTCYYVTDTSGTTVFGNSRRNKFVETYCAVTNQQYFWNLTYGIGYWTYSNITDGTIAGFTDTLVGAVINGIVYGDTTMDAIEQLSGSVPMYFKIYQNYPNPFNPISKIKFDIAKLGNVKLTIYDVLGREITNLVNERLQPGTYETEWDGSNYSSGVYFYKLITPEFTQTRKMVLVK